MPTDGLAQIPTPPDATELSDWSQHGPDLARRPFVGTVREASGFEVRIEGVQRQNGTCLGRVVVEADSLSTALDPTALFQLTSALAAAGREVEARR